ncbi:MAG: hypothetical protein KAH30_03945, partial [Caldisericia bacterium]|nr:hypothetical protein [Caldisericia bacterium]
DIKEVLEIECPCDQETDCFCVEITKIDYFKNIVYAKAKNKPEFILHFENKKEHKMMHEHEYWNICGYWVKDNIDFYDSLKVTSMYQVECPCGSPCGRKKYSLAVEITEENKMGFIHAVSDNKKIIISALSTEDSKKYKKGTCWYVVGTYKGTEVDGIKVLEIESSVKFKAPFEKVCFELKNASCDQKKIMIVDFDLSPISVTEIELLTEFTGECWRGECWEFTGNWISQDDGYKKFKAAGFKKVNCPCD